MLNSNEEFGIKIGHVEFFGGAGPLFAAVLSVLISSGISAIAYNEYLEYKELQLQHECPTTLVLGEPEAS